MASDSLRRIYEFLLVWTMDEPPGSYWHQVFLDLEERILFDEMWESLTSSRSPSS
jgi:hypothetical protein